MFYSPKPTPCQNLIKCANCPSCWKLSTDVSVCQSNRGQGAKTIWHLVTLNGFHAPNVCYGTPCVQLPWQPKKTFEQPTCCDWLFQTLVLGRSVGSYLHHNLALVVGWTTFKAGHTVQCPLMIRLTLHFHWDWLFDVFRLAPFACCLQPEAKCMHPFWSLSLLQTSTDIHFFQTITCSQQTLTLSFYRAHTNSHTGKGEKQHVGPATEGVVCSLSGAGRQEYCQSWANRGRQMRVTVAWAAEKSTTTVFAPSVFSDYEGKKSTSQKYWKRKKKVLSKTHSPRRQRLDAEGFVSPMLSFFPHDTTARKISPSRRAKK